LLIRTPPPFSDSSIVSGDALGNTQFWDGKTGTLISSFKSHQADILSLGTFSLRSHNKDGLILITHAAVDKTEKVVFSSGVDNKVAMFRLVEQEGVPKWIYTSSVRSHTHDVNCLAISHHKDLLVSGG